MTANILWFCGLSGAGKTTIADTLNEKLAKRDQRVLILDGDVVRQNYTDKLDFTPEAIRLNNRRVANMCLEYQNEYDFILIPIISPFLDSRRHARKKIGEKFTEIFINTPIQSCIKHDAKGLYRKALKGEIENFIGISPETPFEAPQSPEIEIRTEEATPDESARQILNYLIEKQLLPA